LQLLLQIPRQDLRSLEFIPTKDMSFLKNNSCLLTSRTDWLYPKVLEHLMTREYRLMRQHNQVLPTSILPIQVLLTIMSFVKCMLSVRCFSFPQSCSNVRGLNKSKKGTIAILTDTRVKETLRVKENSKKQVKQK
jgi:hypothetical protein